MPLLPHKVLTRSPYLQPNPACMFVGPFPRLSSTGHLSTERPLQSKLVTGWGACHCQHSLNRNIEVLCISEARLSSAFSCQDLQLEWQRESIHQASKQGQAKTAKKAFCSLSKSRRRAHVNEVAASLRRAALSLYGCHAGGYNAQHAARSWSG